MPKNFPVVPVVFGLLTVVSMLLFSNSPIFVATMCFVSAALYWKGSARMSAVMLITIGVIWLFQ